MNIIGCLDRPSEGRYILEGVDVMEKSDNELSSVRNKKIGFVFQSFNLISRTSALKNVELPMVYGRVDAEERKERAMELLRNVGLEDRAHHMPNELSGGQKQRVAIARALANKPQIILADEPTGNLDSQSSVEIMEIFSMLNRKEGNTVIIVTHERISPSSQTVSSPSRTATSSRMRLRRCAHASFENIILALTSIKSNKMRSFLTMLGIIIGISSVIAITSIGASAKGVVGKEFESYGMNNMYIYLNWELTQDGIGENDLITPEDIEALKARFPEDIKYVVPNISMDSNTKVGRVEGKVSMYGVGADYSQYKNMTILYGRMINKSDVEGNKDRIAIEKKAALNLFNRENAVGETLSVVINGEMKDLTVVGVFEVPASIFEGMFMSNSYSTYVPYSILQAGDKSTYALELYTNEKKDQDTLGNEFTKYLSRIKDKDPKFYIFESAESQMTTINKILGTLSVAIGAIAAISLVVGGIGIMNIMLVSVTERTREIGIRKSLGARTKDILMQFLIESMIISAIGGVIGTILGVAIAAVGMSFAKIAVVIDPKVIILAVGFSAMVGMFFGLYPARKAAKLDPIEALRYE